MKEILEDMHLWFRNGSHGLYPDMLQCERKKEAGFFVNTYITMDVEVMKTIIENAIGQKVGLRYRPIVGTYDKGLPVRAIHVELDRRQFYKGLNKLSEIYGKSTSGFQDGRKIRFFASLANTKSDLTKGKIKSGIERQKFFIKHVHRQIAILSVSK